MERCVPPDALQKSLDFFYQDYPIYYFLYVISRAIPDRIAIPRSSISRICQSINIFRKPDDACAVKIK